MRRFIKTQMLASGISNAILNSLFTWLVNKEMAFTSGSSVAVDTFFTTGFVSCLVTFPTSYFTRKAMNAGLPLIEKENIVVNRLPRSPALLWLLLWIFFLVLFELLLFIVLKATASDGISFLPLVVGKFVIYGLMGGFVGAFVAFRYLQPVTKPNQKTDERRKKQCSNS